MNCLFKNLDTNEIISANIVINLKGKIIDFLSETGTFNCIDESAFVRVAKFFNEKLRNSVFFYFHLVRKYGCESVNLIPSAIKSKSV